MATPKNLATRLKAYELYAVGLKKSEIARELGVTKACISQWSQADSWDGRLAETVRRAETAVDLVLGDQVAAVLTRLRGKLAARVAELERLCSTAEKPATRLSAISLWFKLADVKQVIPNPTKPTTPATLELIQDLVDDPDLVDDTNTQEEGRVGDPSRAAQVANLG